MAGNNRRAKKAGRGREHSFIAVPHYILKSDEFGQLTPAETKLLFDLAKEYKGTNNGDFSAAFSVLKSRGWKSAGTLAAAKLGLISKGWALCTRHGGSHRCSLYGLTWWPLDDCSGKSAYKAEAVARHDWRKNTLGSRYSDGSSRYADSNDETGAK